MRFYKFIGNIKETEAWNDSYGTSLKFRAFCSKVRRLSDEIFKNNGDKAGAYFSSMDDVEFDGIVIVSSDSEEQNPMNILNPLMDNLLKLPFGFEYENFAMSETTFEELSSALEAGERNRFVKDSDEILAKFSMTRLNRERYIRFSENLIEKKSKTALRKQAKEYCIGKTFNPEIDRIYAETGVNGKLGHPVHYIIETDRIDARRESCKMLLSALKANDRIQNERYAFIDADVSEYFHSGFFSSLYKMSEGGSIIIRFDKKMLDNEDDEFASPCRDYIDQLSLFIRENRNKVLTIICIPKDRNDIKQLIYESCANISFVEIKEDLMNEKEAINYLKYLAKKDNIDFDDNLKAKVKKQTSYYSKELRAAYEEWLDNKLKHEIYGQYANIVSSKAQIKEEKPKGNAFDSLNELVGITEAKKVINEALDYYKAQKLFKDKGMKLDSPAMHMVFTGNPGSCKTTFARIFARIMKENGVLSSGHLVEVGRSDLVGKYVGWTAPTVKKKFKEADGGVLFIDEAYSLVDDRDGSYGDEAINTIVQEMENRRDNIVVIFAGYPDKMEAFLKKNPGLRSRIAFHIPFADYSTEELCDISKLIAKSKGVKLTDGAISKLSGIYDVARKNNDFGNGRFARNIIERAKMKQASRLVHMNVDNVTNEDIVTITEDDIDVPLEVKKPEKIIVGFAG